MNEDLLRFLQMACHRLEGADARAEIGGKDPSDPKLLWCNAGPALRVVIAYNEAPADAEQRRAKLVQLCQVFLGERPQPSIRGRSAAASCYKLDGVLSALVHGTGALAAMVTDERSPLIWGWSLPDGPFDGPRTADDLGSRSGSCEEPERLAVISLEAVLEAFSTLKLPDPVFWPDPATGVVWRAFAGVYRVAVTFAAGIAPFKVEAALVRALPQVEQLILRWPTTDPEGNGIKRRQPLRLV